MLNHQQILSYFRQHGVQRVFYKELSTNDNSKNQPYLGGSYDVISILPLGEISEYPGGKRANYKCAINFSWLTDNGEIVRAPNSKIILYTKYPEVRFSGFIRGIQDSLFGGHNQSPSRLMNLPRDETPERVMLFGITNQRTVIGYVMISNQQILNYFSTTSLNSYGALTEIEVENDIASEDEVLNKLIQIKNRQWCRARYLRRKNANIETVTINSLTNQCHGMTLEAELGVPHNSVAGADWKGWEFKAKRVPSESKGHYSKTVTLMTPEPNGGLYPINFEEFMNVYGMHGKDIERLEFRGLHYYDRVCSATQLRLFIDGYEDGMIEPGGKIILLDPGENTAASWSFSTLMRIWNEKHQNFAIVPCIAQERDGVPKVKFFGPIGIGRGTDFILFLNSFIEQLVKYDPACHFGSGPPKKRNQWRVTSNNLEFLYTNYGYMEL